MCNLNLVSIWNAICNVRQSLSLFWFFYQRNVTKKSWETIKKKNLSDLFLMVSEPVAGSGSWIPLPYLGRKCIVILAPPFNYCHEPFFPLSPHCFMMRFGKSEIHWEKFSRPPKQTHMMWFNIYFWVVLWKTIFKRKFECVCKEQP